MKKLLSLLLVLVMLLSLVACGSNADLEQDLQDLEDLLGAFEEIGDDLYADSEGKPETEGNQEYPQNSNTSEESETFSGDIIEFTTEDGEHEATPEETVPTETIPEETDENELPMDLFVPMESTTPAVSVSPIDENGVYTTMEDVALYIHTYGKLPKNFITKNEARALGWEGGSLEPYAPGKCIGGDRFGNYEGLLPTDRSYKECDIDTLGAKSRGAKRIVFSADGLIYYTDDHYESFTLLYGEE